MVIRQLLEIVREWPSSSAWFEQTADGVIAVFREFDLVNERTEVQLPGLITGFKMLDPDLTDAQVSSRPFFTVFSAPTVIYL